MDLDLTDDQELFRGTTERFIQDALPLAKVRQLTERGAATDPGYTRQAAELGWFSLLVSEEAGGGSVSGDGVVDASIVAFARGKSLQPGTFVPGNVVAYALAAAGSEEQREKVLPAILAGEATATWAVADGAGDFEGPAGVAAVAKGSSWTLDGAKGLVLDADLADWVLVTAATGDGPSQFLVGRDAPGVTIRPLQSLDITRRFGDVVFEDVELAPSSLVGDAGGADRLVGEQLDLAAALTMAESVGAMRAIFDIAVAYAKDRTAFGRPIGSFQAIKHLLADTSLLLESSTAMAEAAARAVQRRQHDASEVVSMAKAYVGDCGIELAQNCFQVFGGIGFTWEHDNHLYLRRLTTDAQLYGDPAWHRERICRIHGL